ncbi:hypothetical protein [Devosia sp.]|uniref:hypothetical protein n=1 Tax=Devosia sp. TaxID=1871048 RepID=UPI003F70F472
MTSARRFLLALLVLVVPVSTIASGAEWSVWDGLAPSSPAVVNGRGAPQSVAPGTRRLPDLAEQTGRLQYIGEMYWVAEACLARDVQNFAAADLNELKRFWEANVAGLSREALWPVRYGLMHHRQGGGTAVSNAGCAEAKAWLLRDRSDLVPEAGAAFVP